MNQYKDYREQHILSEGDIIESTGVSYTITGLLALGGSSVIYSAVSSAEDGLSYAVKEVFPANGSFRRINGVVSSELHEDLEELNTYRKHLNKEHEYGVRCYQATNRVVPIRAIIHPVALVIRGRRYTDVSDGCFAILDNMTEKSKTFSELLRRIRSPEVNDHPLGKGDCPAIHTTACLLEKVLSTLRLIHNQGILFSDISLNNILFSDCELDRGEIGTASYLDFGCARELVGDGKDKRTESIKKQQLLSTDGFIPPEFLTAPDTGITLGKESDIFSVGCLLLRCLFPERTWKYFGQSPSIGRRTLKIDDGKRLGIDNHLRNLINEILYNAMTADRKKRYQSADEMLADVSRLVKYSKPPEYLLPGLPGTAEAFIDGSREDEIKKYTDALYNKNTPVFVWGCGGIGKSEIAIKVGQQWLENSVKGAYFIHYSIPKDNSGQDVEAMEETILQLPISNFVYKDPSNITSESALRRIHFKQKLEFLRENYSGALLIFDNFDWPGKIWDDLISEQSFEDVASAGFHLLFTTRNPVPDKPEWEVQRLPDEQLYKLIRRYCANTPITEQEMTELIEAVDGHTLTIEIVAKTIEGSMGDVTPKMLLNAFKMHRNYQMSDAQYPKVTTRTIKKGQDNGELRHRQPVDEQIHKHLRTLFELSNLNKDDITVLCLATTIPPEGFDMPLFRNCLQNKEKEQLNRLVKCGWLQWTENTLKIHPVIRHVCMEHVNAERDRDRNISFLTSLLDNTEKLKGENTTTAHYLSQINHIIFMCEELAKRIGIVNISKSNWDRLSLLLTHTGQHAIYQQAASVYLDSGLIKIPYATDSKSGHRDFRLTEKKNLRYAAYLVNLTEGRGAVITPIPSSYKVVETNARQTFSISIENINKNMLVLAYDKELEIMHQYHGYLSPKGIMLHPNPQRLPRVFINSQLTGEKTMIRIVDFSVHEVEDDVFGGQTIEGVRNKHSKQVVLIDPQNMECPILCSDDIRDNCSYYATTVYIPSCEPFPDTKITTE